MRIVCGKTRIKLAADPPPDLVIEIGITHQSWNKLPIFAGLGIVEVWRYRKGGLTIFKLEGDKYLEQLESVCLPGVSAERLTKFIADSQQMKRAEWLQSIREWTRTLKEPIE
jgi:Uma2 family endonuclease